MSPEAFSAIEPTEPNFGKAEYAVADLLKVVRSQAAFNAERAKQIPANAAKGKDAPAP